MEDFSAPEVVCFGGVHIDYVAQISAPYHLGSSNPVTSSAAPGGVAHNVALALHRLGHQVVLVSAVGADADGAYLRKLMHEEGLPLHSPPVPEEAVTGRYTAALDADGELIIGLADLDIHALLTPEVIAPIVASDNCAKAQWWCMDANLPERTLAYLVDNKPSTVRLAANPVSVHKAVRLAPMCTGLDFLCGNEAELFALLVSLGKKCDSLESIIDIFSRDFNFLTAMTRGPAGAILINGQQRHICPGETVAAVNVNGAGDCFFAGLLSGLILGYSLERAAETAVRAAATSLASSSAVPDRLTLDR